MGTDVSGTTTTTAVNGRAPKGPRNVVYLVIRTDRQDTNHEVLARFPTKGKCVKWLDQMRPVIRSAGWSVQVIGGRDRTAELYA